VTRRSFRAGIRLTLFLIGLIALIVSAIGYVGVQSPLRVSEEAERRLSKDVGRIMTLDEVLTMSARMAAAARQPEYEARYLEHVEELDRLLEATTASSKDPEVIAAVKTTEEANERLVDLETKSFELDRAGRNEDAYALLDGPAYQQDKAIYALGMQRAFERLERGHAEQTARVGRTARILQVSALLSLAMVLVAFTLEQRERRRQANAEELEATVAQRTLELATRNRAMRLVLDNVQQGLVALDARGRMTSERSAITERWFGAAPEETPLADHLRAHDPTFAASFELAIETLQEDILPIEVAFDQLPRRLKLGTRTLDVSYESIQNEDRLDGILVVMSDITVELDRQRAESEQRELLAAFEHIRRDRLGYANFLDEAGAVIDRLTGDVAPPLETVKVLLHTLKGTTAQFGMVGMASQCHALEARVAEEGGLAREDQSAFRAAWRSGVARTRPLLGDGSTLTIERDEYDSVVDLLRLRHRHETILDVVETWQLDPVQARLERLGEYATSLAERLGKSGLDVVCHGKGLRLDNSEWASFWAACVHVVRNAIDHGIESPSVRSSLGKSPTGKLTITAAASEDAFVVAFHDDGGGIRWDQLATRAAERGMPFESSADRLAVLFADGLSSRTDVTDISGRGIGMYAVRTETEHRGGTVVVASTPGRGTTIEMRFPRITKLADRAKAAAEPDRRKAS
jgi:hypothetical protein